MQEFEATIKKVIKPLTSFCGFGLKAQDHTNLDGYNHNYCGMVSIFAKQQELEFSSRVLEYLK